MASDSFYLSDDSGSDGDYEKFRRKKFEYNELVLQEIQKQQDYSPPSSSRLPHGNQGREKRASLKMRKILITLSNLVMAAVTYFVDILKNCRSEAIVACLLLGCTLFQMINVVPFVSKRANAFSATLSRNHTSSLPIPMDRFRHFVDLYDTNANEVDGYIPYLWKIPYSYQPIDDVFFKCMGATVIDKPDEGYSEISIPSRSGGGGPRKLLASMAAYKSNQIFATEEKEGRAFTMMKNPVHFAIDAYRAYSQSGTIIPMEEYMESEYFKDNWMTRALTGKSFEFNRGNEHEENDLQSLINQEVTQDDADFAMEVLSQKILVGTYPQMAEYFERLEIFLSFDLADEAILNCRQQVFADSINSIANSQYPPENTSLWNAIYAKNKFDMQVYKYAIDLFEDEGIKFGA